MILRKRSSAMETKANFTLALALLLVAILNADLSGVEGSHLQNHQLRHQTQTRNQSASTVFAETSSGLLQGLELNSTNSASIFRFLAVPYAEAPIGELRFQPPVELHESSELHQIDSREFGPTCPQFRHLTRFISPLMNVDQEHRISEDCLHLNIYIPAERVQTFLDAEGRRKLQPEGIKEKLPVIVWIPGEGFDFADARQFDGSYLAAGARSIVVVVQYRVGVLGFLNAPKANITGNMGIHDQIMALRWVKNNAALLGGDPENVSLMGRFTGSMSISSMITAPNQDLIRSPDDGKLLFRRVALLSGITVDHWIIDPHQHERAELLSRSAKERGLCKDTGIECLRSIPVDQLIPMADYAWRPSVDNELIGSRMPAEAIKINQFASDLDSILIGETASEGSLCLMRHMLTPDNNDYATIIEKNRMTTDDFHELIRDDSLFYFNYRLTRSNPIQRAIEAMAADALALGDRHLATTLRDKYVEACSSFLVKFHTEEFKRNLLIKNKETDTRWNMNKKPVKIYHYELKYKPSVSLAPEYIKTAAHGDDISLIFGLVLNLPSQDVSDTDLQMTRRMMLYIRDFVHGNEPQVDSGLNQGSYQFNDKSGKRSWSSEGQLMIIDHAKNSEIEDSAPASRALRYQTSGPKFHVLIEGNSHSEQIENRDRIEPMKIVLIDNQILKNRANLKSLAASYVQSLGLEPDETTREDMSNAANRAHFDLSRQPRTVQGAYGDREKSSQIYSFHTGRESDFNTVIFLLMSATLITLSIISISLGVALYRIRQVSKREAKHRDHHRLSDSPIMTSPCNICTGSKAEPSMDDVLADCRHKENRAFSNVFAKLSSSNHRSPTTTRTSINVDSQCTSAASDRCDKVVQNACH